MAIFGRRRAARAAAEAAALRGAIPCPLLLDAGVSPNARVFKVNIGHASMKMHALLHAIVVADSPEEAGEILLRWAQRGPTVRPFIESGEFILEEVNPHRKGVL